MSRVAPLTALFSIAGPILFDIWKGQELGFLALAGIALAIPAVMLIAKENNASSTVNWRLTVTAICAGLGLASFYICLKQTDSAGGLWVMVVARFACFVSVGAAVAFAVVKTRKLRFHYSRQAVGAEVLDGIAMSLVLVATNLVRLRLLQQCHPCILS